VLEAGKQIIKGKKKSFRWKAFTGPSKQSREKGKYGLTQQKVQNSRRKRWTASNATLKRERLRSILRESLRRVS